MKKILIILIAFGLSGCATNGTLNTIATVANNFTVTQSNLDGARNSYDGTALATLSAYSRLPRCSKGTGFTINNPCHTKNLLVRMRNADHQVELAFAKTQDQITSGDNTGTIAAWNSLQIAIAVIKKIISDNGIGV